MKCSTSLLISDLHMCFCPYLCKPKAMYVNALKFYAELVNLHLDTLCMEQYAFNSLVFQS